MAIKDWQDDWRVPVLTQEMPIGKEIDRGKDQTPVGDKVAPKKPNSSQKSVQQNKGGVPKKGTQVRTKDTTQAPK
jgi:hypothetical protein